MRRVSVRWGLPVFVTAYFSLAMVQALWNAGAPWSQAALPLLLPLGLLWALRRLEELRLAHQIKGSPEATWAVVSGAAVYVAQAAVPLGSNQALVMVSLALFAASAGALQFIAGVEAPGGLEPHEPRATSRDALWVLSAVWTLLTCFALARLLFPSWLAVAPLALDAALTFACLGSLCLLLAAEARVFLLRGLELGTLDRAKGGLSILIAALLVAVGAVFFEVARLDVVTEASLVAASVALALTKMVRDPGAVVRGLRRTLAFLLVAGPLAVALAALTRKFPAHATLLVLFAFPIAALIGASAERLAAPLRPTRGRWAKALVEASTAALDADAERALTRALERLKRAEPRTSTRPEVYALTPTEVLAVDRAGNLFRKSTEFPKLVHELALMEPYRVLRRETLHGLEVRRPEVRPALHWLLSHEAACAVALLDPDGPAGLLVLPQGERRSPLSHEEAQLLGGLAERLSGIVAVHSALARSRAREEASRSLAETEHLDARALRIALQNQVESRRIEARILAEPLEAAVIGSKARQTLQAIEELAESHLVVFLAPPGIDPVPWAAHLHLKSDDPTQPIYRFDAGSDRARAEASPLLAPEQGVAPFREANGGTLIVLSAHLLGADELARLLERSVRAEPGASPARVVLGLPRGLPAAASPPWSQLPRVELPELHERPEDLQSIVLFELGRLSRAQYGEPTGIGRAALAELVNREYPGGDHELRALLLRSLARSRGRPIALEHLSESSPSPRADDPEPEPEPQARARSRTAPRSRYN